MSAEHQQLIRRLLPTHFFIYEAGLAHILGSPNDALIIGNLLYWKGLGAKGEYIYKTISEMQRDTGLAESQQRAAIKRCVEKGLLEVQLKGIPAKRHFKLYINNLKELIASSEIIAELDPKNARLSRLVKDRTITNNTQKTIKDVNTIYEFYVSTNNLDVKRNRLTEKKALLIMERLTDAGEEMVREAIVNCAANPFYNGTSNRDFQASFDYIFKSYENIEKLANLKQRIEYA